MIVKHILSITTDKNRELRVSSLKTRGAEMSEITRDFISNPFAAEQ